MKTKIQFIILILLFSTTIYSQTNYTLNGNLGIGGMPTHKLTVEGNSKMTGELTVTEKVKMEGDVEFSGDLKLLNMSTGGTGFERLLYLDDNGKIQKITNDMLGEMVNKLYNLDLPCSGTDINQSPIWSNAPGVLYFEGSPCYLPMRLGVNTNNPSAIFEVETGGSNNYAIRTQGVGPSQKAFTITLNGTDNFTIFGSGKISSNEEISTQSNMGVGANSNNDVQLLVETDATKPVGFCLNSLNTGDDSYGVKILSNNPTVKAFAINDAESGGVDAFRIMGNGYVYATGINVMLKEEFPDYVFEADYKLMPLNELKTYIATNKRLPNMPSAEKVGQNGLDLGESDRLLTEKVEELTLYILLLNDKIEALIKDNKELRIETKNQ